MRLQLPNIKEKMKQLISWISLQHDPDEDFFQPETLVFVKNAKIHEIRSEKNKTITIIVLALFFLTCAVLYAATLKGVPGNMGPSEMSRMDQATFPFELSPERGRYAHTYAFAEHHSFSLDQALADVVYPDVGYVDGRFYSFFAPGLSVLAVPMYTLGRVFQLTQVFSFATVSLFALGSMFFLYKIGRDIFKLPTANSLIAPVIFAFGSTSWSYATTLYQHHVSTFLIISSFYAVWRFSKGRRMRFLWGAYVWLSYAVAFTVDYPNLVFMMPIMVYFFFSSVTFSKIRRKMTVGIKPAFLLTAILFFFITGLHLWYNQQELGNWRSLHGTIPGYKTIRELNLFEREGGEDTLKEIEKDKTTTSFFAEENLMFGLYTLTVAPDKGILVFSPIFLLAVGGVIALFNRMDMKRGILLTIAGLNIFLYASFGDPWGGWAFGPRYLIIAMSVLSLLIAVWLSQSKNILIAKIITLILFSYSAAISLIGVLTTNAVPPKVEADFLKMKYGFFLNLDYLRDGISSSYVYNSFFVGSITLPQYYLLLYTTVILLFLMVIYFARKVRSYEV